MTKPTVYLETSVIGYATSRPSRDLIVAGHQQITREWFAVGAQNYELFISQLVISESSSGDSRNARAMARKARAKRPSQIVKGIRLRPPAWMRTA